MTDGNATRPDEPCAASVVELMERLQALLDEAPEWTGYTRPLSRRTMQQVVDFLQSYSHVLRLQEGR